MTDGYSFSGPPWNELSGADSWVHVDTGICVACLAEIRKGRSYIPDDELPVQVATLRVDPDSGSGICLRHAQEAFAKYDQAMKEAGHEVPVE